MFDLVLRGGHVLDGTGSVAFPADVAVTGDRISYLGAVSPGKAHQEIDVTDLVVSPGFIDLHSHSDLAVMHDPQLVPKVAQGITTEIIGQDGVAAAPVTESMVDGQKSLMSGWVYPEALEHEWTWRSIGDYLAAVDALRPSVNIATLVPHGNLRRHILDMSDSLASTAALESMGDLLRQGIDEGAFGLSSGLMYLPCVYADTNELSELTKVCAAYGAPFDVHIRQYGPQLVSSVREVVRACQQSGAPLHLCHFNVAGQDNWDQLDEALNLIEQARRAGVRVTGDQHVYPAASTSLGAAALPAWATREGSDMLLRTLEEPNARAKLGAMLTGNRESDFDNWVRYGGFEGVLVGSVTSPDNRRHEGKTLAQIADDIGKPPAEATLDLIATDAQHSGSPFSVSAIVFWSNDDICARIMQDQFFGIGTDALLITGSPHPRCYGTFPRVLGRFARDRGDIELPEAIRKMTSLAAQTFGIPERGIVRDGYFADLTVFDPATVAETATYADPKQHPRGIVHVITNGQIVVTEGVHTGARPGRTLRRVGSVR